MTRTVAQDNANAFARVDRELAAVIANLRTAADEVEAFRASLAEEVATEGDSAALANRAASYLVTNISERVMGSVSHGTARAMRSVGDALVAASHVAPAEEV